MDTYDTRLYAAHKIDNRIQTVREHLEGTAERCAAFTEKFDSAEIGRLCGLAHDIGKYSQGFQHRISEDGPKVDHASAGAIECFRLHQPFAAMCVMGHHGGLMNLGFKDALPDDPCFYGRKKRYSPPSPQAYDYSAWQKEFQLPVAPTFSMDCRSASFYTRMLYSCLVDADFLDTAAFMGEPREGIQADWEELNHRLDAYTAPWYPPKGELNRTRCAILDACRQQGESADRSLFTLTVPTGGGKTVSSLAFALRHAQKAGKDRIIYVIPYTAIIEQTAAVFREILGDGVVLEHHSGMVYDDESDTIPSEAQLRMRHATENWDMPIVVTTAVQFFESLYSNRPSRCRKLHRIANSVVIFDEAQMLPLPYLRPCVYAIAELTRRYHTSAVLCTATQPALDPLFDAFIQEKPLEICPAELRQNRIFKRVTFCHAGELSADELATRLNRQKQVLCIVSSRAAAQELFRRLEGDGCFHLSTLMPPAARQRQLDLIRTRLKEDLPCRVVSTSLIEAGVDVDFPTVYREFAGLDSILQAAGRCNREGKRNKETSEVHLFTSEWRCPPMLSTAIGVSKRILRQYDDPSEEAAIQNYFDEYMIFKGEEAQDAKHILSDLSKSTLPFADVAERFHLIESNAVTIYIPTEESRPLIEQYQSGWITRTLMRKLGRYGVTVYPKHLESLLATGDVEALEGDVYVLRNEDLYSEQTGLSLAADGGQAIFL